LAIFFSEKIRTGEEYSLYDLFLSLYCCRFVFVVVLGDFRAWEMRSQIEDDTMAKLLSINKF
jgi:hypothetical protein